MRGSATCISECIMGMGRAWTGVALRVAVAERRQARRQIRVECSASVPVPAEYWPLTLTTLRLTVTTQPPASESLIGRKLVPRFSGDASKALS